MEENVLNTFIHLMETNHFTNLCSLILKNELNTIEWKKIAKELIEFGEIFGKLVHNNKEFNYIKDKGLFDKVKDHIPEFCREEITVLPIHLFTLSIIYSSSYKIFNKIFYGFSSQYGKELSLMERNHTKNLPYTNTHLTYGEISFFPFAEVLYHLNDYIPPNATIYDLGSGLGKALVVAALITNAEKIYGIEILESLVNTSKKRVLEYENIYPDNKNRIEILHVDLLYYDNWTSGNLIFCHGTCFDTKIWEKISKKAERMKKGSIFISTSYVLSSVLFEIIRTVQYQMDWGNCTIFVQKRKPIGRWAGKILQGKAKPLQTTKPMNFESNIHP